MCNPLTSSHYACASHFAPSAVDGKLLWFLVIGTVCSVQTIMVHAVILITVNKDQLWQYLKLLSIVLLWIWSQPRGTSGLLQCGERDLPHRGVWCQVLPLVHFIACLQKHCGSSWCSCHLWPKSDCPHSGTRMCCAIWNIPLCFWAESCSCDYSGLWVFVQAFLTAFEEANSSHVQSAHSGQSLTNSRID